MLTLGIHDGHTSTACLFDNGQILACISEDRLNRDKEWTGFPQQAVCKCLEISGKKPQDIVGVGVCSFMPQIGHTGYHNPGYHKRIFGYGVKVAPQSVLQSHRNIRLAQGLSRWLFRGHKKSLLRAISALGISTERVESYEHHQLHAATSYYLSWYRNRKTLVVTLDGSGDAVCASLSIGEGGELRRIAEVFNYNSICDFYTRVTQFLAMKPMSHEYKVMGMAPYAGGYGMDEVKEVFRSYFSIDPSNPLQFVNNSGAWKWQFEKLLERDLKGRRFDTISGALQQVFEEVIIAWIRNAIRETGIRDIALSGGGFMNVKLNYKISNLEEVDSVFVFPSCGDDSNPIGASILAALELGFPYDQIKPLGMVYWGPEYSNHACQAAIDKQLAGKDVKVARHDDVNQVVAEQIAAGKVVGRMRGRMEWGARALGNRSIVADPRNGQIIHKINKAIKMRDFWMPFAPAILDKYRDEYLKLRDDFRCPYMTVAPESKEAAWDSITAGLHPFDRTSRCQILDSEHHPDFYDMVSKYERITGVGGVLNTSFNLHGDPIVCTPEDAIHTFLNSGLEALQLEDYVVEKN